VLEKIISKKNLKNPFTVHTYTLTLLIENDFLLNTDRFRVVVPKKNLKKAVWRNRVKRQIKELLFDFSKSENLKANIIVICKESAYQENYEQLKKDFNYAIKKYKNKR
jgi:ribonuclease P protein component